MRTRDYFTGSGTSYTYSTSTTGAYENELVSEYANRLVSAYNGVPITIHQSPYPTTDPDELMDAIRQWTQDKSHYQDFITWFYDGHFVPTTDEPELPPPANDEELEELLS